MPRARRTNRPPYTRTTILDVIHATGRSPKWVAGQMGYDRSYLYKVQAGDKPITARFVERACRVLALPPLALFFADELREGSSSRPERNIA